MNYSVLVWHNHAHPWSFNYYAIAIINAGRT